MRKTIPYLATALLFITSFLLVSCGGSTGTLQFYANGEDFVRQGFVSKDGWHLQFDHAYITLTDITAYQSDPPYDPHQGGEVNASKKVSLAGVHTIDLAEGDENAAPIFVGEVTDAPAGQYNALHFRTVQASNGPAAGNSLELIGRAEKGGETIHFTIRIPEEYTFTCGEYVGDERKGILEEGGTADLEMTFHFDHIFGDANMPMDDDLNRGALGFDAFAALAQGGTLDIDLAGLKAGLAPDDYQTLTDILPTLGHVGEGHCHWE